MNKVKDLPLTLGIHSTYKGYHYLVTSLEMILEDETSLIYFSKNIFPFVAKKYRTSVYCIERNIRTVIRLCWNSSRRELLQNITPYPLKKAPTVGEFLDILYWHIKPDLDENNNEKIV
jgi:hypothetical protein